jgi:ABC-type multidrug transport system ATPase subunit
MISPYLQISDLSKRYGTVQDLRDVDLELGRGDVLALLGPNGAGKSTLFGCLLGLTFPTSGSMKLAGKPLTHATRQRIGYVSERVSLYPQRSIEDNVTLFAQLKGFSRGEARDQVRRVGLVKVLNRKVCQLSKGMLQRVGLAIALCGEPDLMILDEPFNGLDPALLDTLQSILQEETRRGATLLISTHTMSAVEPLATHAAILLRGQLRRFGTVAELRTQQPDATSLEAIYHQIALACHTPSTAEAFA